MGAPRIDLISGLANPFINADMPLFQRGVSVGGQSLGRYLADRFTTGNFGFTNYLMQQILTGPQISDGIRYPISTALQISPEATHAPTGSQVFTLQHRFEAQFIDWLMHSRMKFGFLVRSNKVGTYSTQFLTRDFSGSYLTPFTINDPNVWQKVEIELDMRDSLTFTPYVSDNSEGLEFIITLDSGPDIKGVATENQWVANSAIGGVLLKTVAGQVNFFDSTANTIEVTGFRALPLDYVGQEVDLWAAQPLDRGLDLARAQRYYETTDNLRIINDDSAGSRLVKLTWQFKTQKRVPPSVTVQTGAIESTNIYNTTFNGVTLALDTYDTNIATADAEL